MTGATGQPYYEFRAGEQSVGGMMEIQKEWGEVPPNWAVYFAVDDCDATMEKAKELGGKNEMQPMDIENVGRFVMLQDPQGGHFLVIQMKWCAE
jgi:predicted enzyme related to lactoylglutathione lyase